ncbi:Prominin-2, partial [Varanus komodoensis]
LAPQVLWKAALPIVVVSAPLRAFLPRRLSVFLLPHQAALNRSESQIGLVKASFSVQTQRILRQELDCFMKKEVGYISQYLNWVRSTLAEDVASCQPVSTALDSARVILCDRIVDPWNAFWFSLGSCTFFLIPSIFFSIKTVQHFRPVRHRLM